MSSQFVRVVSVVLLCLAATVRCGETDKYAPDPEIEKLIEQTASRDKAAAQAAIEKLSALGNAATKALNWHLFKEPTPAACVRWAELIAKCGHGRVGYRVAMELQPDGSGSVTLSSDRALLADCGKRFARINGQPEPQFTEEDLKHNPYGKAELLKHLNDNVKFQEARVETHGEAIEAMGMLSFKNFDAFSQFADSFDEGYYMVFGTTLTDSSAGTRTFLYRTQPEENRELFEKNMLLFHNITWEYVLEFNGKVTRSNATRTEGNKLIWNFNCHQILTGQAVVQVSYAAAGLTPRPAAKDNALPIPPVASANQPTAVITNSLIRARICPKTPEGPRKLEILKEQNQLVELDGSGSTPRGASLQYQWTQTVGADLNLDAKALARSNVFLVIKEAGEYRFELVVSANNVFSKPAEVKVIVDDEDKPATVAVATPPKTEPAPVKPEPDKKHEPIKPEPAPVKPEPAKKIEPVANPSTEQKPTCPTPTPNTPVAYDPAKAKDLFEQGEKLMKQFKYAEARTVLTDAYAADPNNKECAFELGVALLECNEIVLATTKFEEVAQSTRNPKAAMYIGHCNARAKNLNEARQWYRRGGAMGKGAVEWESYWQLGNSAMRDKDYKYALGLLLDAEKNAAANNVKDYRLPRDLAITYQGLERWDEALTALNELVAMGYTPDPKNFDEVRQKASGKTPAVASADPVKKKPEPAPVETKKEEPKKEPVAVAEVKPVKAPEPVKPEPAKTPEPVKPEPVKAPVAVKPPEPKPEKIDPKANAAVVDLAALEEKKKAESQKTILVQPNDKADIYAGKKTKSVEPVANPSADQKPAVAQPGTSKPVESTKPAPTADPVKPVAVAPPVQPTPKPAKKPPVKIVKKPTPPVPEDFDQALAAGKRACEEGGKLNGQTSEEAKQKMADLLDEAEAMLQGAWAKKPGDETVMTAFKDLSKYVRVIAIPRNPVIKVKPRALVVLDAGLSIVPGTTFYCVWEQIDGDDLGIRPEEMAKKVVGLPRSMKPGTYTFELAVSDGTRGGNPVKVTVEVAE